MISHGSHEDSWQTVKIAANHLLLISLASTPDLILTDTLQLCHLDARASADMSLLLRENAGIFKNLYDPLTLKVVEGCCRIAHAAFD